MSAGRCMHHALAIALLPIERWAGEISKLPATCTMDCAAPRSCKDRNADYLRVQYRVVKRRQDRDAATALAPQGLLL